MTDGGKGFTGNHKESSKLLIGNYHKGKKRSEETKAKMRESRKKQIITQEAKIKMSIAAQGRISSRKIPHFCPACNVTVGAYEFKRKHKRCL